MPRKIQLSKRAEKKLEKLLYYLESEWSEEIKKDFIKKFDRSLNIIRSYPESFPKTDVIKGLHKCIVTKQTTIYYKFDRKNAYIVTLFDNRQYPGKLKKEISGE